MFQSILDELVAGTGARAAAFCDFEGEAVAVSPRGETEYDIKVAGATLCAPVLGLIQRAEAVGAPRWAAVRTSGSALLVALLKDGYYVVLLLAPGRGEARARHQLDRAAARLLAEM